jgi:hypothetical protein
LLNRHDAALQDIRPSPGGFRPSPQRFRAFAMPVRGMTMAVSKCFPDPVYSAGHHSPKAVVNTSNACSTDERAVIARQIGSNML